MSPDSKIIILTGAPSKKSLDWSEIELSAPILEAFKTQPTSRASSAEGQTTSSRPTWRSIPLEQKHVPTGLTQTAQPPVIGVHGPNPDTGHEGSSGFLDLQSLSSQGDDEGNELTQFLEQSFALHEDVASSQPQLEDGAGSQNSAAVTESMTISESSVVVSPPVPPLKTDAQIGQITALKDIPSISQIISLRPQKIMRSLVVAVLSIPPIRPCKNRWGRYSRPADRLELTVADETRSGFGVNLWLPPVAAEISAGHENHGESGITAPAWPSSFNQEARALRLRDIAMLRNVALTEYQGKVYANSREGLTKIEVLFRFSEGSHEESSRERGRYRLKDLRRANRKGEPDHLLEKTCRIWDWLVDFVGVAIEVGSASAMGKRKGNEEEWDTRRPKRLHIDMPPDTQ